MTHRGPFQPLLFCDSVKQKKWKDIVWYTISSCVLTSVLKYNCPVLTAKDFCSTVCNNKKYSRAKNTGLLHALTCGQWVGRSSLVLFVQGLFEENNYRMIIKNIDILFFRSRGLKTHLGERRLLSIQLECIKQSRNKTKTLYKSSFEKYWILVIKWLFMEILYFSLPFLCRVLKQYTTKS